MQRKLMVTKDGSHTVEIPALQVSYHSMHGAIQESLHVFIKAGLEYWFDQHPDAASCTIFEMGFGTGLNALLSLIAAEQYKKKIVYESVEAFPLEQELLNALNYCQALDRPDLQKTFSRLHSSEWNNTDNFTDYFSLKKVPTTLFNYSTNQPVNLIYFDAFAPNAQPELWTEAVFQQLYNLLVPGGILVTYCSKGSVRRAMQAAAFTVEKLPGPPGKREMLRAMKNREP